VKKCFFDVQVSTQEYNIYLDSKLTFQIKLPRGDTFQNSAQVTW